MSDIVELLRGVAQGRIPLQYSDFIPLDWRPGAIPLLLWDAADEIERLRVRKPKRDRAAYMREYRKRNKNRRIENNS